MFKLFYKGAPIPLATWFRPRRRYKLECKNMLENVPNNINSEIVTFFKILLELNEYKYKKQSYSVNNIYFSLLLRYSSIKSYRVLQEQSLLLSISLL